MCARASRPDRLAAVLTPRTRFLWGTALLLLYLPQGSLVPKLAEVAVYGGLAVAAGKRVSWPYFLLLVVSIAAFHMLTPWGRVLLSIGPVHVTEGALLAGLSKGFTVVGLVFISLFAVSRDLRLPGRFGLFLGRSFYYFERLYAERRRIRRSHVWEDMDAILESAFAEGSGTAATAAGERRNTAGGFALIAATAALTAAALVAGRWLA